MKKEKEMQWFSKHKQMDYELQCILGGCRYGSAEVGEVLYAAEKIKSGDFDNWVNTWVEIADNAKKAAESSGSKLSAGKGYLRAANYYAAALSMIDGSDYISRVGEIWKMHMECFSLFCSALNPPAEIVNVPYGETHLPCIFFKPDDSKSPRKTIIFNNGSDSPTCAMWGAGVSAALERGYAALIFDGPGQNYMLYVKEIPFRHDWENVISPIVEYLVERDDVLSDKIALSGMSQGGYWVLRALAFEHRIAAGIADPGVMDVSRALTANFPKRFIKLFRDGNEKEFNREMGLSAKFMGRETQREIKWRMKPYGTDSCYQWLQESMKYNVRDVIDQIKCPMFIADPEDEQFWPGQSVEVYEALNCPKTIVSFTREDGTNRHCQPLGRGIYDQRMLDWLDDVMK